MGRKSSIKLLPSDLRDQVNKMLAEDWSLDDIVEARKEAGHPRSRSALGRYKKKIDAVAEKMEESRVAAEALASEIGADNLQSKQARVLVELFQSFLFRGLISRMENKDKDEAASAKDAMMLARAIKDAVSAQKIDAERELKIRREVADKAADAAESAAREAGLSAERAKDIREKVLGVRPKQS